MPDVHATLRYILTVKGGWKVCLWYRLVEEDCRGNNLVRGIISR
jgi:hypothetical protein